MLFTSIGTQPWNFELIEKEFIPVFIDWKPNEVFESPLGKSLCLVGLISDSQSGLQRLLPYKKTRTPARKLASLRRLSNHIRSERRNLKVIAIEGRTNGQYVHWACETINRMRDEIGAEWRTTGNTPFALRWNNHEIDLPRTIGLVVYAVLLPIIGLRVASLCKLEPIKSVKLCLDALPGRSTLGLAFMRAISMDREIKEMWLRNAKTGFSFEIGVLESYSDGGDSERLLPGKGHPNAILVDWFAVCCLAKLNPVQFRAEGNFSETEVQEFSDLWTWCEQNAIAESFSVDDKELLSSIKAHSAGN